MEGNRGSVFPATAQFRANRQYHPKKGNRASPVILITFLLTMALCSADEVLSWTNQEGQNIQAAFLGIEGDNVKLQRSDGRRFSYPLANLSAASQARAKELQKAGVIAGLPTLYHNRIGKQQRGKAINQYGGDPIWLNATARGLEWLAGQQNPDGSFGKKYTAASTGLSVLAFLGFGQGLDSDEYGETLTNAVAFLMDRGLKDKGLITNGTTGHHQSYEHAIATQALIETLTMSRGTGQENSGLESIVKKALDYITDGSTSAGGWAYGYSNRAEGDLSLSNWQIQALWLANESGLEFKGVSRALEEGVDFVLTMQDDKGAFKYRPSNEAGKPTLTGGALFSIRNGGKQMEGVYTKGIEYLSQAYRNPSPGTNYYAPYFNTLAFFHDGGDRWKSYRDSFFPKLIEQQETNGSWPDRTSTLKEEGGVMSTAWALLMLETIYRYNEVSG